MSNNGWSNQTSRRLVLVVGSAYSGIFFYDPAIAFGDLILSIAPNAGTDPYGNSYPQGFAFGFAGASQVVIGTAGGSPLIYFPTGNPDTLNSAAVQTVMPGSGAGRYDQIQVLGAQSTAQNDSVLSTWLGSSQNGAVQPQIQDYYHDPSGTYHLYRTLDFTGDAIRAGSIVAVDPTTGTSRANPAQPEAWHAMSLLNSWTNVAGTSAQYRLLPTGDVQTVLSITGGTVGSGTPVATLPAGYRPAHTATSVIGVSGAGAAPVATPSFQLDSSGSLTMHNVPAGTTTITFNGAWNLTW